MIGFLLYKIYTNNSRNDEDTPRGTAFTYICLTITFLNFSVFLVMQGFLELYAIQLSFLAWMPAKIKYYFFLGAVPVALTYLLYFYRKDEAYYELRYKDHWLNTWYFGGLLFLVPFFLFFIGPVFRILLFGGYMLGRDYPGWLQG